MMESRVTRNPAPRLGAEWQEPFRRSRLAHRAFLALTLFCGFFGGFFVGPPASAADRFYTDWGFGAAYIRQPNQFFNTGTTAPSSLGFGPAFNFTFGINLFPRGSKFAVHLGVQYRYTSGTDSATPTYYGIHSFYPIIRFEGAGRVYVTFGGTIFTLQRAASSAGIFDGLQYAPGVIAAVTEVGFQIPITPAVSLIPTVAGQLFRTSTGFGPEPSIEFGGALRFYIDAKQNFDSPSAGKSPYGDDYQGWRYPYGTPK